MLCQLCGHAQLAHAHYMGSIPSNEEVDIHIDYSALGIGAIIAGYVWSIRWYNQSIEKGLVTDGSAHVRNTMTKRCRIAYFYIVDQLKKWRWRNYLVMCGLPVDIKTYLSKQL